MASPSSVLTRGLGAWGSVSLLVTHGFGISDYVFVDYADCSLSASLTGNSVSTISLTGACKSSISRLSDATITVTA